MKVKVLEHRLIYCDSKITIQVRTQKQKVKEQDRNNFIYLKEVIRGEMSEYLLKENPLLLRASSASRSSTKQTYSPEPDFSLEGGKSTLTP